MTRISAPWAWSPRTFKTIYKVGKGYLDEDKDKDEAEAEAEAEIAADDGGEVETETAEGEPEPEPSNPSDSIDSTAVSLSAPEIRFGAGGQQQPGAGIGKAGPGIGPCAPLGREPGQRIGSNYSDRSTEFLECSGV